jgi:hypothetical protein
MSSESVRVAVFGVVKGSFEAMLDKHSLPAVKGVFSDDEYRNVADAVLARIDAEQNMPLVEEIAKDGLPSGTVFSGA